MSTEEQLSKIISDHTRPEDLERLTRMGFHDGSRIRVIVEIEVVFKTPTFRGIEYRLREDKK